MNYPKEAVDNNIGFYDSMSHEGLASRYAQWAHDQLRPRKVIEEKPPMGAGFLGAGMDDDEWHWCEYNEPMGLALLGIYWWKPLQPPPNEDGFEEWWESLPKQDKAGNVEFENVYRVGPGCARAVIKSWQAALKSKEAKDE